VVLLFSAIPARAGQTESRAQALPEAPQPQLPIPRGAPSSAPCPAAGNLAKPAAENAGTPRQSENGRAGSNGHALPQAAVAQPEPCPPKPPTNWLARFLNGPEVKPLTPKEKAHLAARNLLDPFNAITILGSSAILVGSDADSPYGPGMRGFGSAVGVSYTQEMTGEFFGVFLIPSIVHQDPHYHRMPNATMKRRITHAIYQVAWTQGDNGKGMVNYANLVGFAIDDEISNLYVPGRETDLPASAERYATGLGAAPIDNFITEFLPDVARHIHIRVVLIQRIINQVATSGGPGLQ
jgi:hypothetical protein